MDILTHSHLLITYQALHPADKLPLTLNYFLHSQGNPLIVHTLVYKKLWRRVQALGDISGYGELKNCYYELDQTENEQKCNNNKSKN